MKNVLVITYFFPPLGGGGIQRVLKLAKYLPEFNWNPIVLTVDNGAWTVEDSSLSQDKFLKNMNIVRVEAPETKRHFYLREKGALSVPEKFEKFALQIKHLLAPDPMMNWAIAAKPKLDEICSREKIDLVFTTCPPLSENLLGRYAQKKYNLPWVADFRDSLETSLVPHLIRSKIKSRFGKRYENMAVRHADRVITINDRIVDYLCELYGNDRRGRIGIIPNGFDEEDFAAAEKMTEKFLCPGKMLMTYTGGFQGARTPEYFLKALDLFIDKDATRKSKIEVRFVGDHSDKVKKLTSGLKHKECVNITGHVPYRESLACQMASDALLHFVSAKLELGGAQVMTGKIYEYLRSRRLIFAMVPESGAVAKLIKENGAGIIVPQDNPSAIAESLENTYKMWQNGKLNKFNENLAVPSRYDRKILTGKFSEVFNSLTER